MVTDDRLVQLAKTDQSSFSVPSGRTMFVRLLHQPKQA